MGRQLQKPPKRSIYCHHQHPTIYLDLTLHKLFKVGSRARESSISMDHICGRRNDVPGVNYPGQIKAESGEETLI